MRRERGGVGSRERCGKQSSPGRPGGGMVGFLAAVDQTIRPAPACASQPPSRPLPPASTTPYVTSALCLCRRGSSSSGGSSEAADLLRRRLSCCLTAGQPTQSRRQTSPDISSCQRSPRQPHKARDRLRTRRALARQMSTQAAVYSLYVVHTLTPNLCNIATWLGRRPPRGNMCRTETGEMVMKRGGEKSWRGD